VHRRYRCPSRRHGYVDCKERAAAEQPHLEEVTKRQKFFDSQLTMPPEIAGEKIVCGLEKRKARILIGSDAKFAALVERLCR
jgi:hypothetical protein